VATTPDGTETQTDWRRYELEQLITLHTQQAAELAETEEMLGEDADGSFMILAQARLARVKELQAELKTIKQEVPHGQ